MYTTHYSILLRIETEQKHVRTNKSFKYIGILLEMSLHGTGIVLFCQNMRGIEGNNNNNSNAISTDSTEQ